MDHLVWGGRNLDEEIDRLEALTGVRAARGGAHPGAGTHNALLRLGAASYLELIAPDPAQAPPAGPRWFGLDDLTAPGLVTWAARATDLERRVAKAREAGLDLGEVRRGQRRLRDGELLTWRLTQPEIARGDGLVPFLIDWGESPHPAERAPAGIALVALGAEHPDPPRIRRMLEQLGVELQVSRGPTPALIATLDTPRGRIALR
ncbi:MAG TPA: VOC family protein [Gemmatimonadales bacterium]|nr:VOC family protein [Gemmatimonadales bacterium]